LSTISLQLNTWYHVAAKDNGLTAKIYINGVENNSFTISSIIPGPSNQPFRIGAFDLSGNSHFDGTIDDVRLYATALSDKDILDLYNTKAEIEQSGVLYARDFLSNAEETVNLLSGQSVSFSPLTVNISTQNLGEGKYRVTSTSFISPFTFGTIRLNLPAGILVNGLTYNVSLKYRIISGSSPSFSSSDWCDQSITREVINFAEYTLESAFGSRSTYDNTFKFMDYNFSANTVIEIWDIQLEQKAGRTPFVSTFRPAIELPTGVQFGADEVHETGTANFEDFSTVGITDGLIAYYPLNGNLIDYSGNSYNAINNGLIVNSDHVRFDAQADNINFNNNGIFVPLEKTLIFTIRSNRPLSVTDNWEIGFLNQGSTLGSMFGMMYGVGNCQDLGFWGYGVDYDASVESVTNKWSSDGNWHHVVLTMNALRQVRIYVDGQHKQWLLHSNYTTLADFLTLPINTTNYFLANSRGIWDSGMTFVDIGEIKIFNRPLTDEEIKIEYNTMFNNQVQIHESGVVYAKNIIQY
jgi:hypothetical protein